MKLHDTSEVTMSSGQMETSNFQLKQSAKAFKVLSSNLYKHKIRAIVRELSCNADDAHVDAGNPDGFHIQAPTQLDPRFVIRDFGTGLSHSGVMKMYTTYFESTKEDSNEFIGALGLGSKSPFSYTETFTVVSYFNGRARGYNAYMNGGMPQISMTFDEETTEKNGLEITVPVRHEDIDKWHKEILYVLRPFNERIPVITGMREKVKTFPKGDEILYANRSDFGYYEEKGIYAIMGKIVYPLPDELVKNRWLGISSEVTYIHFPLGVLDITPSREELSMDDQTAQAIDERISEADKVKTVGLVEEFTKMPTIREALEYRSQFSWRERDWIDLNIKIRGKSLKDWNDAIHQYQSADKFTIYDANEGQYAKGYTVRQGSHRGTILYSRVFNIGYQVKGIHILVNDITTAALKTIKGIALAAEKDDKVLPYGSYIISVKSQEELDELKPFLTTIFPDNEVKVFYASKLEHYRALVAKIDPAETRPKSPNVIKFTARKRNKPSDSWRWDDTEHCLTASEVRELKGPVLLMVRDTYHPIAINSNNPKGAEWKNPLYGLHITDLYTWCEHKGIKEFYALRSSSINQFDKAAGLFDMWEAIMADMHAYIDDVDYTGYGPTLDDTAYGRINSKEALKPIKDFAVKSLNIDKRYHVMYQFTDAISRLASGRTDDYGIEMRAWYKTFNYYSKVRKEEMVAEWKQFCDRNPAVIELLKQKYYWDESDRHIIANMVEFLK